MYKPKHSCWMGPLLMFNSWCIIYNFVKISQKPNEIFPKNASWDLLTNVKFTKETQTVKSYFGNYKTNNLSLCLKFSSHYFRIYAKASLPVIDMGGRNLTSGGYGS